MVQILLPLCWQSTVLVIAKHVLFIEILSNSPRFIHKWINFPLLILQWDLGEASIHIRAINMYNNHPYQGDPAGRGWWKPYEGEFHQNPEVFRLLHESFWQKQGRHRNRGDVLQQNIYKNEMTEMKWQCKLTSIQNVPGKFWVAKIKIKHSFDIFLFPPLPSTPYLSSFEARKYAICRLFASFQFWIHYIVAANIKFLIFKYDLVLQKISIHVTVIEKV